MWITTRAEIRSRSAFRLGKSRPRKRILENPQIPHGLHRPDRRPGVVEPVKPPVRIHRHSKLHARRPANSLEFFHRRILERGLHFQSGKPQLDRALGAAGRQVRRAPPHPVIHGHAIPPRPAEKRAERQPGPLAGQIQQRRFRRDLHRMPQPVPQIFDPRRMGRRPRRLTPIAPRRFAQAIEKRGPHPGLIAAQPLQRGLQHLRADIPRPLAPALESFAIDHLQNQTVAHGMRSEFRRAHPLLQEWNGHPPRAGLDNQGGFFHGVVSFKT
jgi:hypothetical protein